MRSKHSSTRPNPAGRPRVQVSHKKRGDGLSAEWTRNGFGVSGSGFGGYSGDRLEVAVAVGAQRSAGGLVASAALDADKPQLSTAIGRTSGGQASFAASKSPTAGSAPTGTFDETGYRFDHFATVEDPDHDITNPRFGRVAAKDLTPARTGRWPQQPGLEQPGPRLAGGRRAWKLELANQRADFAHKAGPPPRSRLRQDRRRRPLE